MKFTSSEISSEQLHELSKSAAGFVNDCNEELDSAQISIDATNELESLFYQAFNKGQEEGYRLGFEKAGNLLSAQIGLSKACEEYVFGLSEKIKTLQLFKDEHKNYYQPHTVENDRILGTIKNLTCLKETILQLQKNLENALTNRRTEEAIITTDTLILITNYKK